MHLSPHQTDRPCFILWMTLQKCTDSLWPRCTKKDLTHSITSASIMTVAARPATHQLNQTECLLPHLQKELWNSSYLWRILITPVRWQNLLDQQLGQLLFLDTFFCFFNKIIPISQYGSANNIIKLMNEWWFLKTSKPLIIATHLQMLKATWII